MKRDASNDLDTWLKKTDRKPLVIRGARQVGKTWLVRDFAQKAGKNLVELNFERHPEFARFFAEREPQTVIRAVEAYMGARIHAENALLFLDEIQAAPEVLANLRWFAEEMPQLPVVATGSLLDFVLAEHSFSMPVGRISYLHLEPMSFEEFLSAIGQDGLRAFIGEFHPGATVPDPLHLRLLEFFRDYLVVGGMPAAVSNWRRENSLIACAAIQQDLLASFRDDFAKYTGRVPMQRLERVLNAVPRLLGRKFTYSQVDREERSAAIRQALELLCRARLCHKVQACDGVGIPLSAGVRESFFKVILLDVGLVSALLGLHTLSSLRNITVVNEGALAEQAMGQVLRTVEAKFKEPALFYWTRERKGSAGELDYLLQHGTDVVPIEVKAGATGTLKSLHLFMALRRLPVAVRFNADLPSVTSVDCKTTSGARAVYRLLSLPFYLAGRIHGILDLARERNS
jgi:predicted AAA+ superfamily ATPase